MVCCSPSPRARFLELIYTILLQYVQCSLLVVTTISTIILTMITQIYYIYIYYIYVSAIYIYLFTFSNWLTISSLPPHNTGVNLKIAQPGRGGPIKIVHWGRARKSQSRWFIVIYGHHGDGDRQIDRQTRIDQVDQIDRQIDRLDQIRLDKIRLD